jgi:hypothetical protein
MGKSNKSERFDDEVIVSSAPKKQRKSRAKKAIEVAAENIAAEVEGMEAEVYNFQQRPEVIAEQEVSSSIATQEIDSVSNVVASKQEEPKQILPQSSIEHLKASKVGEADLGSVTAWLAALGPRISNNLLADLFEAPRMAAGARFSGDHAGAARKVQGVFRSLRDNDPDILDYELVCRDGTCRTIGYILQWYSRVHWSAADKIELALSAEAEEMAAIAKANALAIEVYSIPVAEKPGLRIVEAKRG